jgi:hypothetical protein
MSTCTTTTTDAVAAAVAELARSYRQWRIGTGRTGPVQPQRSFREGSDRNYTLLNDAVGRFLQWEHQTWGINLGWTDDAGAETGALVARWFLARQAAATGPVRYGEVLAVGNGTQPSFVKFQERTFGINLGYADDPHYEWTVLGGTPGTPVGCGEPVAIHNVRATSASVPGLLRWFDRSVGGDLGWPDTRTWGEPVLAAHPELTPQQLKQLILKHLTDP